MKLPILIVRKPPNFSKSMYRPRKDFSRNKLSASRMARPSRRIAMYGMHPHSYRRYHSSGSPFGFVLVILFVLLIISEFNPVLIVMLILASLYYATRGQNKRSNVRRNGVGTNTYTQQPITSSFNPQPIKTSYVQRPEPKNCPSCGSNVLFSDKYCQECGTNLSILK